MMQAGRFAQARDTLRGLLRDHPNLVQARWLLGGALLNTGDFAAAESEARSAITLAPGVAALHSLLGDVLASQGRMREAEAALQHALQLDPTCLPAVVSLAKVMLVVQRASGALLLIDDFHKRTSLLPPELMLLRAQGLLALGRHPDAAEMFRRTLQASPNLADAELGLAVALAESEEYAAAESAARRAIAKGVSDPAAHFVRARSLLALGQLDDAEASFRNAIAQSPEYVDAQTNLAELVWMRTGDIQAATGEIDKVLGEAPKSVTLRALKARLLEAAGDPAAALAELDAGLALDEHNVDLHIASAQIALKRDADRALAHAERARKLVSDNPLTIGLYCNALLAAGQPARAQAFASRLLTVNPDDGLGVAILATAWRILGDGRYSELVDYGQFVRPSLIDTPDGWPDLHTYLDDLAAELLQRHTLQTHPVSQSLRHGTQADLVPGRSSTPAIRAFEQAIDGPIRRYMQAIGSGKDVLRRRNNGRYRIAGMWSVRLRPNGYHFNHFHPEGWLSSACYIRIPPAVQGHRGEGWLQFGEPAFPTRPPLTPEYFVRPEPGLLVLFPSWMWHGTVPFSGSEQDFRLTIAFDVVPS